MIGQAEGPEARKEAVPSLLYLSIISVPQRGGHLTRGSPGRKTQRQHCHSNGLNEDYKSSGECGGAHISLCEEDEEGEEEENKIFRERGGRPGERVLQPSSLSRSEGKK